MLSAWADTRVAMRADARALVRRRARLWERMRPTLAHTPALSRHATAPTPGDIEPIDAAAMRSDVGPWNSAGINHAAAVAAAIDAENGGLGMIRAGVTAGFSTGTGGARGLFLASAGERARYVGQMVAKLLPAHALLTGARIALVLRADNQLYREAGRGRFAFLHLPLGLAAEEMADALDRFAPTVMIAPPRELAALAASGRPLPAGTARLLWGSEPMAPAERAAIGTALGIRLDPVYQATEGFIAAPCLRGTLHLNDDAMAIDLEPVTGTDAVRPIVTDLRRHVQPMIRVRLDDLLRPAICDCGSALRAVEPVLGRGGDIWRTPRGPLTPDIVDDHFTRGLPPHARWRARGSRNSVTIELVDAVLATAIGELARALLPAAAIDIAIVDDLGGPKRRRVTWREG